MTPFRYTTIAFIIILLAADYGYFFHGLAWWWLLIIVWIYVSLLVLGAINIQWNFYLKSLHRRRSSHQIALTFDDGPATETAAILDILRQQKVPAAFFSIGKNAAAHPEIVRRWDTEGHVIGTHSYYHGVNFDWKGTKAMAAELRMANDEVKQIIGKTPLLFRPPYGVTNPNLARAVKNTGMTSIGWSLRSFDTMAKSNEKLLRKLLRMVKGGDIILLHDSMKITREILTQFIVEARKRGYTFARVDELLQVKAYA